MLKKLKIDQENQFNQNYLKFIHELRNKIAHTGYIPTRHEADKAFLHANVHRKFLAKKVHRTQYTHLKRLLALKARKFRQ